jgi:cell division protein FtsQ
VNGRQRVPGAVTAIVAVLAIGIAAWVVVTSALFDIHKIDVRGNRRLSDGQVARLSGARIGSNLLTLPLGKVRRSLLRSPWIASAEAVRSLPSTLVLHVTERSAVAWVRDPSGYAALAGDGVVVERGTESPEEGLVSLGSKGSSTPVGRRVMGLDAQLRVTASLDPVFRRTVEEATVDGKEVELLLAGGTKVLYGEAESLKAKNAALSSMLRYARQNQIEVEYLDVRSPTAPALRPA